MYCPSCVTFLYYVVDGFVLLRIIGRPLKTQYKTGFFSLTFAIIITIIIRRALIEGKAKAGVLNLHNCYRRLSFVAGLVSMISISIILCCCCIYLLIQYRLESVVFFSLFRPMQNVCMYVCMYRYVLLEAVS